VQTPGDIVRLAIVLSVVPSFKSVHFQQDVVLGVARWICAAQPGYSAYMYEKHFHDAKSWQLCCISPAPASSAMPSDTFIA